VATGVMGPPTQQTVTVIGMLGRGYNTINHCNKIATTKSMAIDCFNVLVLSKLLHIREWQIWIIEKIERCRKKLKKLPY